MSPSLKVARTFRDLGLPHAEGLALTGVKASLAGAADGPSVAILGELDALPVPGHPYADAETGAAHACGHHAQIEQWKRDQARSRTQANRPDLTSQAESEERDE